MICGLFTGFPAPLRVNLPGLKWERFDDVRHVAFLFSY